MPSNIEIKAVVEDVAALRARVESLADGPCQILRQEDFFFPSRSGRLKLRMLAEEEGELIYYERPDSPSAKRSDYQICKTDQPRQLRRVFSAALGESVVVRKRRYLYLVGQTRVHIDEVEDLGTFMELEVVLRPHESPDEGHRIARELMLQLGVSEDDLMSGAYADLLRKKSEHSTEEGT